MVGAEADHEQYKCAHDADCRDKCKADHCKEKCLELPSKCSAGVCVCPFGPEHSAERVISSSKCASDSDCTNFCPTECNIKTCVEAKCSCGCHRWNNRRCFFYWMIWNKASEFWNKLSGFHIENEQFLMAPCTNTHIRPQNSLSCNL